MQTANLTKDKENLTCMTNTNTFTLCHWQSLTKLFGGDFPKQVKESTNVNHVGKKCLRIVDDQRPSLIITGTTLMPTAIEA